MQGMFNGAASFNQDISGWCVEKITEEPSQFSFNSPLLQSYKPIWGSCGPTETGINPNIYLDTNGVTIKCEDAALGEKGLVNGKEYTVVDDQILRSMIQNDEDVTCVCTSLVENMTELIKDKDQFNQDISSWDTSNVIYMQAMFSLSLIHI